MTAHAPGAEGLLAENRQARFRYEILETLVGGLVLQGSEVKSLRAGRGQIGEAYASFSRGELWLVGAHIAQWLPGGSVIGFGQHDERRPRKILLKQQELKKFQAEVQQQGLTMVPLRLFFGARGKVKVLLALGKGKNTVDKRHSIRAREEKRTMLRVMKGLK